MFLKIKKVNKELVFIKYDEIRIIELQDTRDERSWRLLIVHLAGNIGKGRCGEFGEGGCGEFGKGGWEEFLISTSNDDVDFICDQIDKYNDCKLRGGSNLKDIKKDEKYQG